MAKAVEAAQTIDFDRLSGIPNTLDAILYELRVTTILLATIAVGRDGNVAGVLLAARTAATIDEATAPVDEREYEPLV